MNVVRAMLLALSLVVVLAGATVPAAAQQTAPVTQSKVDEHSAASVTGATVANIWYVPGRALVCGGGLLVSATIMTVTFGHSYDDATVVARGTCSGPWLIRPDDIRRSLK
jgi:hypothetical protein